MCSIKDCYLSECGYWIDKSKHIFKRNIIMPAFCCTKYLRDTRNNVGIFKTAYRYNTNNQNEACIYGDFYLDFDSTDFELVRADVIKALSYMKIVFNININNNCSIFFSGNKGAHIVIPAEIFGVEPSQNLNEVYKIIAESLYDYTDNKTLDLRIYDKKRMFRIPNSIHEVTNLHKVNITYEEVRNKSYNEIKEIAKDKRIINSVSKSLNLSANKMFKTFITKAEEKVLSFNNIRSAGTLTYEPPCIKQILEQGALSGQRNNTVAIIASYFKARGNDMNTALDLIKKWNDEKTANPLSEHEIFRTTQSIYSTDMQFGCSAIKNLDLCSKEYCKFKK